MTEPRMPIEEARRLWREQRHTAPVTDNHTLADPTTGEPINLDVTTDVPVIYTPAMLGYTIEELDPDDR
ncbi:MAG: hypothetical protein LC749_05740 [Actinobacteria bacterium]|nr:hypothetical protein [Actinomycetota bacterium]